MNQPTANPFALAEINAFLSEVQGKGNTSQFFLQLGEQSAIRHLVMLVKSDPQKPVSLHSDFHLLITVLPQDPLELTELIGKPATFCRLDGGQLVPLHGVIANISASKEVSDPGALDILLASPLHLLKKQRHNRVYVDRPSTEVIKEILQTTLGHLCDVEVLAKPTKTSKQQLNTQYQESDYDFVQRVLAREGLFVFCAQGQERTALKIIKSFYDLPASDRPVFKLPYVQNSGSPKDQDQINLVEAFHDLAPRHIELNNYDPDSGLDLKVKSQSIAGGQTASTEIWGLNYSTPEEGKQLADQSAACHEWRRQLLRFVTNAAGLLPGHQIEVIPQPPFKPGASPYEGNYRVISLNLYGDQSSLNNSGGTGKEFLCEAYVLPLEVDYRPEYQPRTSLPMTLSARITQEVDEQGCYRLQYPFDQENQKETASSLPVRQLQAFGGPDHGMHFPLAEDTEVVISGLNGDLDRPVILGALFHQEAPDLVTSDNARTNLIQTRGGQTLCMDDQPEKEHILLATPESKNRLLLDATTDAHKAELISEEGDVEILAGKNLLLQSGGSQFNTVGEDQQIEIGGSETLLTEEGDIQLNAGQNLMMDATENIQWRAEEGHLSLSTGVDLLMESEGQRFDAVKEGDYSLAVEQGSYLAEVDQDLGMTSASGNILLETSGGTLQISSEGDLLLEGGNIELTADSILVAGSELANN